MPADFVQWQDFLTQPKTKQNLALYGNFGFTLIIVLVGIISTFIPFRAWISVPILVLLVVFAAMDALAYRLPLSLGKLWKDEDFEHAKGS